LNEIQTSRKKESLSNITDGIGIEAHWGDEILKTQRNTSNSR
jgi:hypothetical protein